MNQYGLGFINDHDLFEHVKQTIEKYRFQINLKEFNRNLIDPIKLTFDAKIYGKTIEEIIESESLRQIDKSNTNHIGYFHQNIFRYLDDEWEVPDKGYDLINRSRKIFVKIKNKYDIMDSSSVRKTQIIMQDTILRDRESTCYLVEIMSVSQDVKLIFSCDPESLSNKHIRRISIDKFYEIATEIPTAFRQLCEILPTVIDDVFRDSDSELQKANR